MILDSRNVLKGTYKEYQICQVKQMIKGIPKERRGELADIIEGRAKLFGCKDENALKAALESLRKEEKSGLRKRNGKSS